MFIIIFFLLGCVSLNDGNWQPAILFYAISAYIAYSKYETKMNKPSSDLKTNTEADNKTTSEALNKKIYEAKEINDVELRKWFEDFEERVQKSDDLKSLKGKYYLSSLEYLKKKDEEKKEAEFNFKNVGSWFLILFFILLLLHFKNTILSD